MGLVEAISDPMHWQQPVTETTISVEMAKFPSIDFVWASPIPSVFNPSAGERVRSQSSGEGWWDRSAAMCRPHSTDCLRWNSDRISATITSYCTSLSFTRSSEQWAVSSEHTHTQCVHSEIRAYRIRYNGMDYSTNDVSSCITRYDRNAREFDNVSCTHSSSCGTHAFSLETFWLANTRIHNFIFNHARTSSLYIVWVWRWTIVQWEWACRSCGWLKSGSLRANEPPTKTSMKLFGSHFISLF